MSVGRQQLCFHNFPPLYKTNTAVLNWTSGSLVGKASRSSQENCTQLSMSQFFLTQFAEPGLGSRFEQAELGHRKGHFGTNLVLVLFAQVETRQDFAIAL